MIVPPKTLIRGLGWASVLLTISAIVYVVAGQWELLPVVYTFGMCICAELFWRNDQWLSLQSQDEDRLFGPLVVLQLFAFCVIASLDVGRFQWSSTNSAIMYSGLAGFVVPGLISLCTPLSRPRPIETGAYRWIRHPQEACLLAEMFGGGVALGSWPALVPLFGLAAVYIARTLRKDRIMQRWSWHAEYAQRVRFLLLPGVF